MTCVQIKRHVILCRYPSRFNPLARDRFNQAYEACLVRAGRMENITWNEPTELRLEIRHSVPFYFGFKLYG